MRSNSFIYFLLKISYCSKNSFNSAGFFRCLNQQLNESALSVRLNHGQNDPHFSSQRHHQHNHRYLQQCHWNNEKLKRLESRCQHFCNAGSVSGGKLPAPSASITNPSVSGVFNNSNIRSPIPHRPSLREHFLSQKKHRKLLAVRPLSQKHVLSQWFLLVQSWRPKRRYVRCMCFVT